MLPAFGPVPADKRGTYRKAVPMAALLIHVLSALAKARRAVDPYAAAWVRR